MAHSPPVYDLTLLLDADAPSERRAEILREVEAMIGRGGEVVSNNDWGVRAMAYEIAHHKDAEYHLIQLKAPPELLDRLRGALRVTDGVLRHRIIRLPPNMGPPPALRPEPRAPEAPASAEATVSAPAEAPAPPPASEAPAEAPAESEPAAAEPAPAEAPAAPADEAPAEAPSPS